MNITKLVGLAMAAVVVSTSLAFAGGNGVQIQVQQVDKGILQLKKVAGCDVAGTPSEFPDDIWLTNKGVGKLVAGTKIKWSVQGYSNFKGTHTLVADLAPGKGVHLSGVLGGGVEAGHACTATAL